MKNNLLVVLFVVLIFVGCGTKEPTTENANPLSVLPENVMVSIIINNSTGMVNNIDGYIEEGAAVIGQNFLENLICTELHISSFDSIPVNYGIDPSGQIVFWMENATPQSMGLAASAPDFDLFITVLEDLGQEVVTEEPINDVVVYSVNTDNGTKYLAGNNGVALVAASLSKLEEMLTNLSTDQVFELAPTSLTINVNLAMIGPMAAAQMPMAKMMMMQGMASDTTMPDFVPAMMDVYMDGFEAILTQADQLEFTLITGSEEFVMKKRVSFLPETELATMFVATEAQDMLPFITQGDIATVRYQMPEELTFTISKAFSEVFTTEISDEMIGFWSEITANGAMSLFSGDFVHMVAAYETDGSVTLEQIAEMFSEYFDAILPILQQNEEMAAAFSIQDNGIVQIDGFDFYSISMNILSDSEVDFNFDYWITIHDGVMLLETAEHPGILLDIISGGYTPADLPGTGAMAGEMSLAGYLGMVMSLNQDGMELPEIDSDVIISWDSYCEDGVVYNEMSFDGSDAVATGFVFAGLIGSTL